MTNWKNMPLPKNPDSLIPPHLRPLGRPAPDDISHQDFVRPRPTDISLYSPGADDNPNGGAGFLLWLIIGLSAVVIAMFFIGVIR